MKQFHLPGMVNNGREQPEIAKFLQTSTTKRKTAQNAERSMNQGVVRPPVNPAKTAKSRTISQKSVGGRNKQTILLEKKTISKKTMAVPPIIRILLGISTISRMVQ